MPSKFPLITVQPDPLAFVFRLLPESLSVWIILANIILPIASPEGLVIVSVAVVVVAVCGDPVTWVICPKATFTTLKFTTRKRAAGIKSDTENARTRRFIINDFSWLSSKMVEGQKQKTAPRHEQAGERF